jgi:hypothetical protein
VDASSIAIIAVIFFATFIRSAFGFGEALVAVPLLALLLPVEVAVPLAALFSITVAVIVIIQDWRKIHFDSAWRLVVATLFGIPLGLLILTTVPEAVVKSVLAIVIISFSLYCLVSRGNFELKTDRTSWAFGFAAGVLGGAYAMNGPPLVVYGAMRRWSPEHFRATLQGYFFPASVVQMAGYWLAGLWVPAVSHNFVICLTPAIGAIFLGRFVNRRMSGRRFVICIHVGLIVLGSILLAQSLWPIAQKAWNQPASPSGTT